MRNITVLSIAAAAIVAALYATRASHAQPRLSQDHLKISEGHLKDRVRPAELDPAMRLKRFSLASKLQISPAQLGAAVTFTPRQLYIAPGVHATVSMASISGGSNSALLFKRASPGTVPGTVHMDVRPAAGKPYLADCTVERETGSDNNYELIFAGGGSVASKATVSAVNDHIVFAVPKITGAATVTITLRRADYDQYTYWYGCDFVPVSQ